MLSRPIDTKGNIKIYFMDIGQIHYGTEIEVAWVTSQWQTFVSVLLILRVLKAKNGVLYHFLRLQYLSDFFTSSYMKRTLTSSSFRFKHEQCIVFNIVEYEFRISVYLVRRLN